MIEHDLVTQLKAGCESAFRIIYHKYWSLVFNFTRLYISSPSEAEEVVQEVFVKFWEARHILDTDKPLKGFLFIITRNLIFNKFRRNFNEVNYKMTVLKGVSQSYEIEDDIEVNDLKLFIDKLIEELPIRQKEVFKLSREKNLTHHEISTLLSISEKTIERHITEAIKFIKKRMTQHYL